ncbi:MAG TPA: FISUMP domain-containing protein [Fibrobacteraceae bacterium]|nr:FISUMP domain-containing protein [Fibrobacteraceae bacterium]
MSYFFSFVCLALSLLLFSCGGGDDNPAATDDPESGSSSSAAVDTAGLLTDSRDGQVYRKVVIGSQVWMAQNLNYSGVDSVGDRAYTIGWCYGVGDVDTSDRSDAESCNTYGRFYRWQEMMGLARSFGSKYWDEEDTLYQGICPDGWHVPTGAEWDSLVVTMGGVDAAGEALKSAENWNGTNTVGFNALPAGIRYVAGAWEGLGTFAYFWSTEQAYTSSISTGAYTYYVNENAAVVTYVHGKFGGASLRCVQNP